MPWLNASIADRRLAILLVTSLLVAPELAMADPGPSLIAPADASGEASGFTGYLSDLGLLEEAAAESDRLDVADPTAALSAAGLDQLAQRLVEAGHPQTAARVWALAVEREPSPEQADELRVRLALLRLRHQGYPEALHLFGRVAAFGATPELQRLAERLQCLAHVYAHDGTLSRTCVAEAWHGPLPKAVTQQLDELALDPEARATIGGWLSGLLPGLGQSTGGDPGDGAMALLVNGGWEAGTAALLVEGAALDASLLALGVGLRYYVGNIRNGAQAWRSAAERRRVAASQGLLLELGRLDAQPEPTALPQTRP
ncbi:MAG: hypothetical protein ACOYOB_03470 [Myxococcota bacterium]